MSGFNIVVDSLARAGATHTNIAFDAHSSFSAICLLFKKIKKNQYSGKIENVTIMLKSLRPLNC